MRHENPLEEFPYGDPPPHWKIRQIDPPPSSLENPIPSVGGGGFGYFLEPHIRIFQWYIM